MDILIEYLVRDFVFEEILAGQIFCQEMNITFLYFTS